MPETDAIAFRGAETFATHCSGCHTIGAAGTQGSANRAQRVQGPDFDQRSESYDDVLFAIRNGGFSGAIMPQNIIVGDDATAVAEFLVKYSGSDVVKAPRPLPSAASELGEDTAVLDDVGATEAAAEGGAADEAASQSEDAPTAGAPPQPPGTE